VDSVELKEQALGYLNVVLGWLASPPFYAQVAAIFLAVVFAKLIARQLLAKVPFLREQPTEGAALKIRHFAYSCRDLVFPLVTVAALAIAVVISDLGVHTSWLVRLAQSVGVVLVLYAAINRFVGHPLANAACRWIGIPVAALQVFGYLDDTTAWLDTIAFSAGNIRISAFALIKAAVFGGILFWLGRMSTSAGQKVIRDQHTIDIQTRELVAKFFEIAIFFIVAILLLNILGLDLTALAVFGGALGVGLGFGLQQIASNFISGIIILLERSLKVGDYIELEDGKTGILREINMRSSALGTFDGKDIMVPNEKFITTRFINWTKTNPHQRYEVPFALAYDVDIHRVPQIIKDAVSKHPAILKRPTPPVCELRSFAANGINFAVEFWVASIDDGKNRISSDVHYLIWDALKDANIAMAFAALPAPPPTPPAPTRKAKPK
jgi:small-conductance mechanosensitive channel